MTTQGIKPLFPDRDFFNMGEASRIVQLPDYTLRYWETRLRLLRPVRRESGHRRYSKRDLETILRIKDLLHNQRMTIPGVRKVLARELRHGGARPAGFAPSGEPPANGSSAGDARPDAATAKALREIRADLKGLLAELRG